MKKILIVFTAVLLNIQTSLAEDSFSIEVFLDGLNSYQADFTQQLLNEEGQVLETVTGNMYLSYPGKFRWNYLDPYVQTIITDSETLWIHDDDLEQVTIRDISDAIYGTPAAVIITKNRLDEFFELTDLGDFEGAKWTKLKPKKEGAEYKDIRLGFKDKEMVMMILNDNLGQTTRIDFSNPKRNDIIESTFFDFQMPEDVDVIDDRIIEPIPLN